MCGGWGETVYHEVLNQGPGPGECMLGWWGGLVEPGPCVRYAVHTWVSGQSNACCMLAALSG